MSKRRVLIVVGLLAALVLAYKLIDRSRGSSAGDGDGDGDGDGAGKQERIERAQARKAELLKAPRSKLGGIVLDAQTREPIAGAIVSLGRTSLDLGARLSPGQAKTPVMRVTGPNGRFRIDGLRAGELSVTASADGYLPTSRDAIALAAGEEQTTIELLLGRGGTELSGTVSDVGGGPISGAFIRARRINEATVATLFRAPVTALTNAEGKYKLQLRDGNYLIEAGHADYIQKTRDTQLLGGTRTEDFSLVPGGIIEGRVLIAGTETPVANAVVTPSPRGGRITGAVFTAGAKTGPDGRFLLSGLKSGEVSLIAVARQYSSKTPKTVVVGIAEHRTDVTLYVDAAYTISGFVVQREDTAKAIPRVMVAAYNLGKRSAAATSDPSAEDGYFEILGVTPGTYTIAAATEGMLPEIANQVVEVKDRDIDGLVVELSQGFSIKGRVDPPVAAYVRLEVDPDSFSILGIPRIIASQISRTTADENGNFELTGLAKGKVTVVAEHIEHGAGRTPVDVTSPGLTNIVVELETTGSISGTVADASGKPVARARVRAAGSKSRTLGFGSSFGDWNSAISNDDGSFKIRGLGAATYRLSVRRDGQRLAWAAGSINDAGGSADKPIEVELDDSQDRTGLSLVVEAMNEKIRGVVIGVDGEPVADAWVKVGSTSDAFAGFRRQRAAQNEGNEEVDDDDQPDDNLTTRLTPKLTDADGLFLFDGLRAGEYWVSATGPRGAATGTVRPVKTGTSVTVKLETMAAFRGP